MFLFTCAACAAELPEAVRNATALKKVADGTPFGFDADHVQGVAATPDFFFATSVNKYQLKGWLFKFDRTGTKLLKKRNIAKMLYIHPSGIDFDGRVVWVAVAIYSPDSSAEVMAIDPETLKTKFKFEVADHIGCVAADGKRVYGGNWGSEQFYTWDYRGNLIEKRDSPTGVGYQDCEYVEGFLMCVGGDYLDWIDIESWKLARRFDLEKSIAGNPLSREGVSYLDGHVFFLPDDGNDARVYEYSFSEE